MIEETLLTASDSEFYTKNPSIPYTSVPNLQGEKQMSVNIQSAILSLSDEHGGSLSIIADNTRHVMRSENPMFGQAVEAYRNEDWDTVLRYMNPEKTVKQYLYEFEDIKVENGAVLFGGSAVHSLCVDRILQFADSNFNPMPLVRFLSKLQKNPSRRSVEELYRFLERNELTVTSNGNFLAYKAVRPDYHSITSGNVKLLQGKDDGSGRIYNGVGETIEVYRNNVDDDANRGCSYGLHAGTLEYAQGFGGRDAVLLIVEIDPSDVVSVPHDCECQKLRTSRYKVVDICTQRLDLPVYDSRFDSAGDDDDWDSWDDDDDTEYCSDCECEVDGCECEDEDNFLASEVNVKDLIGYLFKNNYDDLALTLARKFVDVETVELADIHNIEGDIDFLQEIAQDMGLTWR